MLSIILIVHDRGMIRHPGAVLYCAPIYLFILALRKLCTTYLLTYSLTYLLPCLSTYLRIGHFCFQAGSHGEVSKPGFSFFVFIFCYSILSYGCMFAFVGSDLVFHY